MNSPTSEGPESDGASMSSFKLSHSKNITHNKKKYGDVMSGFTMRH